jgi:DtxR family Mn-dependent transcriptional regulator
MKVDLVYGENTEMYLKTLVELAADRDIVPVTGVAERLGVSTVSASEKVHRLQDQGFVEHLPYKGVVLTSAGRRRANEVLRRHRLWERFLVDHLEVDWQHAHEAACRLEHATPREISEKLAIFLHEPETCPHGNPIPGVDFPSDPEPDLQLSDLEEPAKVLVIRVFPESTPLLCEIASMGLLPGTRCTVLSPRRSDGSIQLVIQGKTFSVPDEIARHVYIRPVEKVLT